MTTTMPTDTAPAKQYRFSGERLRAMRRHSGKRPERIAVDVDRSAQQLKRYEVGDANPPAAVIAALASSLGCEPADFFEVVEPQRRRARRR